MGVILYEMLTGQLPFQAESAVSVAIMQLQRDPKLPTEINGSIPLGVEQITMHAMQKNSDRRYQSAAEMLCDLEQFKKDPTATFEYSYFVDDSPTKFVGGTVVSSTPASAVADVEEEEDETKEKNSMIPILAGIAATLLIAIIVLAIIFVPKLFKSTGAEIECPDFVGKTLEEIKENEEYTENFVFEEEWGHDDEYEYGYVYDQSQPANKKLKKGAEITLSISMGQSTVKVPDVYGKTESYAVSELKAKNFKTVITEIADDEVEAGHVIKTEPARTTVVAEGTEITIYVSTGKATKMVDIPNVVGLTEEKAKSDITKEGLICKVETRDLTPDDKSYPKGYVISQSPDANSSSQVAEGTEITIYVSTGVVNYEFDLTISLPKDYISKNAKVSLWVDNKLFKESEKLDFAGLGYGYTFKGLISTKEELYMEVKLGDDYDDYQRISVDCSNGKKEVVKNYAYPMVEEEKKPETEDVETKTEAEKKDDETT